MALNEDGRDPILVGFVRWIYNMSGKPFDVEIVPRGASGKKGIAYFVAAISNSSRGLTSCSARDKAGVKDSEGADSSGTQTRINGPQAAEGHSRKRADRPRRFPDRVKSQRGPLRT